MDFSLEDFTNLFDVALAEADRAARTARPGYAANRDQAPLAAVDNYVRQMLDEMEALRAYQRRMEAWVMEYPIPAQIKTQGSPYSASQDVPSAAN